MHTNRKAAGYKVGARLLGALTVMASVGMAGFAYGEVRPYQGIPADQAESITTPEHILALVDPANGAPAPSALWQALEHAESVECLSCIPYVSLQLYSPNAKSREIAAWWLRRRIFGVFGVGEIYSQTVKTLQSDSDPTRRAYAASALGEFLVASGIAPVSKALTTDADAGVRAAAASALGRLNDDGQGALAAAFGDKDESVRAAAFVSAGRINSFVDVSKAVAVTGDSSALVRRLGVELLDEMKATDAVAALVTLAQSDPDDEVRLVACHALGTIGDPSARAALTEISTSDSNTQVQDQARIALINL